jgi:hypothetical protein
MVQVDVTAATRRRLIVLGGAVAGVVGGMVVNLLIALASALAGRDVWVGFKVAAYPFVGARVMTPGFDAAAFALGLVDHLAVSVVWGVMFAAVAFGLSRWATVGFGAVWGLMVLFVMAFVVLPMAGAIRLEDAMALRPAVLAHVTFGLAVGLAFLPFQRHEPRGADRLLPRPA